MVSRSRCVASRCSLGAFTRLTLRTRVWGKVHMFLFDLCRVGTKVLMCFKLALVWKTKYRMRLVTCSLRPRTASYICHPGSEADPVSSTAPFPLETLALNCVKLVDSCVNRRHDPALKIASCILTSPENLSRNVDTLSAWSLIKLAFWALVSLYALCFFALFHFCSALRLPSQHSLAFLSACVLPQLCALLSFSLSFPLIVLSRRPSLSV